MKATDVTTLDFVVRLAVAAAFGAIIGFERQWRQRSAGLHTTSLVAIGAALFALLDTMLAAGDTTRIVAGVVTGVGFIAGGVIFRSGANVTGLNTAATIWTTAAVGALAGFGLWAEAGAGARRGGSLQSLPAARRRCDRRARESRTVRRDALPNLDRLRAEFSSRCQHRNRQSDQRM